VPWAEIDGGGVLPGRGRVTELLDRTDVSGVTLREDLVLEND
jgi:hypothetical protein